MSFLGFSGLIDRLDQQTSTNQKVASITQYLGQADPRDAVWAVFFLSGRRIKQSVSSRMLRRWALEFSEFQDWLFAECHSAVGDSAETVSLVVAALKGGLADEAV